MPTPPRRLTLQNTVLVVVDIQELFRPLIHDFGLMQANASRLMRFADTLDQPLLITEHYSQKLGGTVEALRTIPRRYEPVEKISFSCWGDTGFQSRLRSFHRQQVVLCGIETHVCVYQTARDLMEEGYQVVVAADAVSSRLVSSRNLGLAYLRDIGAQVMTTEMILFEQLKVARTPEFKQVADVLKESPRPSRS